MPRSRPLAPRCAFRGNGCGLKASYLFIWQQRGATPYCWRHAGPHLSASATPPSLLAIARWDTRHAEDGWLWSGF